MNYPVSVEKTREYGIKGVFATAGGITALILGSILTTTFIGPVLGGILTVTGIYQFFRKREESKVTAVASLGVGVLGLTTIIAKNFVKGFTGLAGIGLVGYGIYNIVQFIRALKSRA